VKWPADLGSGLNVDVEAYFDVYYFFIKRVQTKSRLYAV